MNLTDVQHEGGVLRLLCLASGGNPKHDSPEYYYSFCFHPNLTTIRSQVSRESNERCPKNYLYIDNGFHYNKSLEYTDRGTYICTVGHSSNLEQMQNSSPVKQLDVRCVY